MHTGTLRYLVMVVSFGACVQSIAAQRAGEQPAPSMSPVAPSETEGSVTEGSVSPTPGTSAAPAPELTPEEKERLLRGTMRKVPLPQGCANDRPNPPDQ
jgi:hypothetical protein